MRVFYIICQVPIIETGDNVGGAELHQLKMTAEIWADKPQSL